MIYPRHFSSLKIMFLLIYGLVITCGLVGNLLVLLTVIWNQELRTPSNMYICNMAVSDMLICLVSAPLTPLTALTEAWHLGQVLCKLVPTIQVQLQQGQNVL